MIKELNSILNGVFLDNFKLFHGTPSKEAFDDIVKNGIKPSVTEKHKSTSKMSPLFNRVYLSKSINYAMIYALGGDLIGTKPSQSELKKLTQEQFRYGYIFEIDSKKILNDVMPDEDFVGELFYYKANGLDYIDSANGVIITNDKIPGFVVGIAKQYASQSMINKAVAYDDYGDLCRIGKNILKHLTPEMAQSLIKISTNFSICDVVIPEHCYQIDKLRREEYRKDLSNFKDISKILY